MKRIGPGLLLVLALPALLIACGTGQKLSHFKQISGLKNLPTSEDYPGQPAVVIMNTGDSRTLYLQHDLKSNLRRQRVLKILNEDGLRCGRIEFITTPFRTVANIKGNVIQPDGKSVAMTREMLGVEPAFGPDVYPDIRRITLDLPVRVGSIIELEWEEKHEGTVLFSETWWFQEELPVVYSRFSLSVDPTWEYSQRQFNTRVEPRLDTTERDLQTEDIYTISWEKRNIEALPREPAMPPPYELREGIAIIFNQDFKSFRQPTQLVEELYAEFEETPEFSRDGRTLSSVRTGISGTIVNFISWNDVAYFYTGRTLDSRTASRAMQEKVAELIAGNTSLLDQVKAIYEFVRSNFQFYDIDFGTNGYSIAPAAMVFDSKYGDSAELSNLLVALLEEAGIECNPVLARTIDHGSLKNFPSIQQFNRVLVAVPLPDQQQILWLDPGFKEGRFGFIPWNLQGVNALMIKKERGEFFQTPVFPISANISFCKAAESIDTSGSLTGTATINLTGNEAFAVRWSLKQADQAARRDVARDVLRTTLAGAELDRFEISNLDLDEENLVITYGFSVPRERITMDGGDISFGADIFKAADDLSPFTSEQRRFDIIFPCLKSRVVKVTLDLPEGYQAGSLPEAWELSTPYADYSSRFFSNGPTLFCEKSFTIKALQVPRDDYERFRDFCRRIEEESNTRIVLQRGVS